VQAMMLVFETLVDNYLQVGCDGIWFSGPNFGVYGSCIHQTLWQVFKESSSLF
jgi:hypothetical protein